MQHLVNKLNVRMLSVRRMLAQLNTNDLLLTGMA